MAYKIEGEICPVCKAYLFNDDDVVFCPTCGAPHHRDCYASIGHCGMEEFHGTENQYSPKSEDGDSPNSEFNESERVTSRCPRCGRESEGQALFCPYCGCDMTGKDSPVPPAYAGMYLDPYGGLPRDGSVKVDGEKLEDVKHFVYSNTQRYLPVFVKLTKKNRAGWNWAAFILPHCWLFFRKQYTAGVVAVVLMLVSALCSISLSSELSALMSSVIPENNTQLLQQLMTYRPQTGIVSQILWITGELLRLGVMVFFGIFGDWFYRSHVVSKIREINANDEIVEKNQELMSKGGISVWGFMLSYVATVYIPQIIAVFI